MNFCSLKENQSEPDMKKIITTALAFTVLAGAFAQRAQIRIRAREAEVPIRIVEAFKADYKGQEATEWAILPAGLVGQEYVVSGYDDLKGEKPTSYEVVVSGSHVKESAIYDQNGKLLYSKAIIADATLPSAVRKAVNGKYPGFIVMKDQEVIRQGKSRIIHYRVIVAKDKEQRFLAVDDSGKILREVKPMKGK
jgi:hypothetical protein